MNFRESLSNLFSPIPEPEVLTPKQMNNAWRMVVAQDRKRLQVRDLDPSSAGPGYPGWDAQVAAALGIDGNPWRRPTVREALGSTAIFRAVSLIANTTGSLAVETYRNGVLQSGDSVPRLVTRPDPFRTARVFYRNTAFDLATYGEAWWWIAKRDTNDMALSLINVPPWEITVDPGTDRLHPTIKWLDRTMDPRDMRQITFLPDPAGGLRGVGPLQLCGAAVSVAIESQYWAANFYAEGGYPSLWIKAMGSLGNPVDDPEGIAEAALLKAQFAARSANTPFVSDEGIEDVKELSANPQGAQMLDARFANKGDAANMFGIPGFLLEYSPEGRSLTYQNIGEVWQLFVKGCLRPNYLEAIEQEMSDLLPRATVAHFNEDIYERADPKARWETYNLMVPVLGQQEAARIASEAEGITPGDIEFQPVPFSSPAAFPTRLPVARSGETFRCTGRKFVGGIRRPCNRIIPAGVAWTCNRCGESYAA